MKPSDIIASPLALGLVASGLILTGVGLFMMVPLKFDKAWCWSNLPIIGMLIIIGYFILIAPSGRHGVASAGKVTIFITSRMYTMLVFLFIVMGMSGVVGQIYRTQIEHGFGLHQIPIALLGGFAVPSPNTVTPLIETLWGNQTLRFGLMYFVQVNGLLSITLFRLRVGGFSPGSAIPTQIYSTSIVLALLMIPLIKPAMFVGDWAIALLKR